jgi:hypothetical protein
MEPWTFFSKDLPQSGPWEATIDSRIGLSIWKAMVTIVTITKERIKRSPIFGRGFIGLIA